MKKIYIIIAFLILILGNGCKKDFLEREPLDSFSDDTYWRTEKEVSTFAWGFYTSYFTGYGSGFTFGKYFSGETLNDDFAIIKNRETGLFDFSVNVFDSFGIINSNIKSKEALEDLIKVLKPANSRVFISYIR